MLDDKDLSESTLRFILWDALKSYPTSELLRLITDEDPIVRTSAAKQLHFRATNEVADRLTQLLSSEQDYIREVAAFGLGQLGTPEKPFRAVSSELLVDLLSRDESADVRAAAAAALGHLFVDESLPEASARALSTAAADSDARVRACVAFALSAHRDSPVAARVLRDLEHDEDADVRMWAVDEDDGEK
jgi:HEAT repeat protein